MGASLPGLIGLLSKDFLRLVVLAVLIAAPLAWYFMNMWLQEYAYRIKISWWVFAATGAATIIIAFVVISFQTIKTALVNPAENLRPD